MGDKVKKFLAKLTVKERHKILQLVMAIQADKLDKLTVKPIKGHRGYFRVRVGRTRIIFRRTGNSYEVMQISYRDDQTYRDF